MQQKIDLVNMFENRRWLIIPTNIVDTVNFNEVIENGPESLRYSLDGTKTFVKYEIRVVEEPIVYHTINPENGQEITTTIESGIYGRPSFFSNGYVELTHQEILDLLLTPEWNKPLSTID
jgi:hypothetical protein